MSEQSNKDDMIADNKNRKGIKLDVSNHGHALDSFFQATSQVYPDADCVHLESYTICEYQSDGTAITWSDNYTRILTERGRREKQSLSFNFRLPYSYISVKKLEIIKPDRSIKTIDIKRQSKAMVDWSQMHSNTFNPNYMIRKLGVPDLQVGDIVHLLTCRETRQRRMPNMWDNCQLFQSTAPIRHAIYEVHAPQKRPLCSMLLKNTVENTVKYSEQVINKRIVYRWEISNVPRLYSESYMPPLHAVAQRLLISTLSDWKFISRWYWKVCKAHLAAVTPEMRKMVTHLTQDLVSREQKVKALFYWVAQNIRHMGIISENEVPGWEPHDASMTFSKRYGVCRDKAALLVTMLRLAGFEAYPVLFDKGPRKDIEVPLVQFNHVITAIRNQNETYLLMDCSKNYRDLLPSSLGNRSYLVACPNGESLRTSRVTLAEENMVSILTIGKLDSEGSMEAEALVTFHGSYDEIWRHHCAKLKPERIQDYIEEILKASFQNAIISTFSIQPTNLLDMSSTLSIRIKYAIQDLLIIGANISMMSIPLIGSNFVNEIPIILQTSFKERQYPLELQSTCCVKETLTLQIDRTLGTIVSLPEQTTIQNQTISWRQSFRQQGNSLTGEHEFRINTTVIEPSQHQQLDAALQQIVNQQRKKIILKRKHQTYIHSNRPKLCGFK